MFKSREYSTFPKKEISVVCVQTVCVGALANRQVLNMELMFIVKCCDGFNHVSNDI